MQSNKWLLWIPALLFVIFAMGGCKKDEKNWKGYFPGIVVDQTTTAHITENAGTTTFTVALEDKPKGDVVIDVTTQDDTRLLLSVDGCATTLTQTRLVFSDANWEAPLPITVCALDNNAQEGTQRAAVLVAVNVDATTDLGFSELKPVEATIFLLDDDTAGISVNTAGVAPFSEVAGKTDFVVNLSTVPVGDVVVTYTSPDTTEVLVSADNCVTKAATATVTFTKADAAPKTFSACGAGDDLAFDGNQNVALTGSLAGTTDNFYRGLSVGNVAVTAQDFSKLYVRAVDGDDTRTGENPTAPLATIQTAITKAASLSTSLGRPVEVLVAEGNYTADSNVTGGANGRIVMVEGVSLIGGFSAADWTVRELPTNIASTIISQISDNAVDIGLEWHLGPIIWPTGTTRATVLDGFKVVGNTTVDPDLVNPPNKEYIAAVRLEGAGTLRNNLIWGGSGPTTESRAIYDTSAGALVENNTILGVSGNGQGAGIRGFINGQEGNTALVRNNVVRCMPAGTTGYPGCTALTGIGSHSFINNTIEIGGTSGTSYAIISDSLGADQSRVEGNTILNTSSANLASGILVRYGSAIVRNNTVNFDATAPNARGIDTWNDSSPLLQGNKLTFGPRTGYTYGVVISNNAYPTIDNNTIITGTGGADAFGIFANTASPGTRGAKITKNNITLGTTTGGTGGGNIAIYLTQIGTPTLISGNTLTINDTLNGHAYGIYHKDPAADLTVDNNIINVGDAGGTGGGGGWYASGLYSTLGTVGTITVTNNEINGVSSSSTTGTARGVYIQTAPDAVTVSNNILTGIDNTNATNTVNVWGIWVGNGASTVNVAGNQVTGVTHAGNAKAEGITVAFQGGDVSVENNTVTIGSAGSDTVGILTSTSGGAVTIRGNTATAGTAGGNAMGIKINEATANVTVTGNTATGGNATTGSYGIYVPDANSVTLTGNIGIANPTGTQSLSSGIEINNLGTGGLVANNLIHGGNATTISRGLSLIGLGDLSNLLVANNTIHGGTGTTSALPVTFNTTTMTNTLMVNNILITDAANTCITLQAGPAPLLDFNNYTGCTTTQVTGTGLAVGSGGLVADVTLVDGTLAGLQADANNWRIDPGVFTLAAEGGQDLVGQSIAAFTDDFTAVANTRTGNGATGWSMGAYELD